MLATSSQAAIRVIPEASFGVIPVTGSPNNLRFTGESLTFAIAKSESGEIRNDRQLADLIPTNGDANGGVNMELSYKEFDTLIEAALMGTWSYYGTVTPGVGQGVGVAIPTTGGVTATGFTATAATTGTNLLTLLRKGQWFKMMTTGGTGTNNGKVFRVSPTTAPTNTVLVVDTATPMVVDAGVTAVTISSAHVENGVVERSFTVERALNDVGQFFAYRGMEVSKWSLKIATGSITTGSFDFMGKDVLRANATQMPGTPVASQTYDVHNGVSSIGQVFEGGAALTGTFIKSIDFSVDNALRARDGLGVLGNVGIGNGTLKVTGTVEVYLADGTLYDKFLNNTTTSLQVVSKDAAGNGYAFTIGAVKYGDAKVMAGGKDQDIMISLPFTAIYDSSAGGSGKTIMIDRFGA
jgi:hypothetical protein